MEPALWSIFAVMVANLVRELVSDYRAFRYDKIRLKALNDMSGDVTQFAEILKNSPGFGTPFAPIDPTGEQHVDEDWKQFMREDTEKEEPKSE